jgi:hypothetical protein
MRARYGDRSAVVVKTSFAEVLRECRGLHQNAVIGTVAAWIRRGWPIVFADRSRLAAFVRVAVPVRAERTLKQASTA